MNNKVGIESDFFSKIFGFFKSFKISKEPFKAIELAFRNIKSALTGGTVNNQMVVDKLSFHSKVINSLNIWNFANKLNNSVQKDYVNGVESTDGSYHKRNPKVYKSVIDMNRFILENYKKLSYQTVFDIYIRIFTILSNKELCKVFEVATKLNKKGNESGSLIYNEYLSLVYVIEYLTLTLTEFVMKIGDSYTFEMANKDYSSKHNTFISSACANVVAIIEKYENVKDPKKLTYAMVESETIKTGTEEDKAIFKDGNNTSQESILGILAISGIVLIGSILAIYAVRYIYYSLSCLKIDLVKSLIEQSELILENIDRLKEKLSKMKEGTSEYEKLKKTIEKQEKYLSTIIDISNKLGDEDVVNAKKITDKESDDDETIDSTDESSTDITTFDI